MKEIEDHIEKIIQVPKPSGIGHINSNEEILNPKLAPIEKLRNMSADQYEDFVLEWAHGYLMNQSKYKRVVRSGGAGDKGRDVIAYVDNKSWDSYQCKYYKSALAPTDVWKELAKLCYYTQKGDYSKPRNYYLMAPDGIGSKLEDYLNDPEKLKRGLIENWDKNCKQHITSKHDVLLEGDLASHIDSFDFSIIKSIAPLELIEQHQQTMWHSYRFGGLAKKRQRNVVEPADNIDPKESRYIKQLMMAYGDFSKETYDTLNSLDSNPHLSNHLNRQRVYFFSADALEQFSRDISENAEAHFRQFKEDIYNSVIETCEDIHDNGFDRVKAVLIAAVQCSLDANNILKSEWNPNDKKGIIHHLANEDKLIWVKNYEK